MKITIKVDLSEFDMRGKKKQLIKGVKRGIKASGVSAERIMKQIAVVDKGHYRASISQESRQGGMATVIGPHKIYAGWVEDGAKSPHAPRKLRRSGFRGHKTVRRTMTTMEKMAPTIVRREIGRALR